MSQPALPPSLTVKAGHVQPVWAGHPWVFKQAIERVDEAAAAGDEVLVLDPHGKILGRGLYSPSSAIAVRIYTVHAERAIDQALLRDKIERAVRLRLASGLPDATPERQTNGFRLVHGEGDGLPGLIVDAFDDVLAVQVGTVGLKRLEPLWLAALHQVVGPRAVIDRTPATVARAEGFELGEGSPPLLFGESPAVLAFRERGLAFELPLELSQKTGFYFDQRALRARIEELSRGSRVLDAFCYAGAVGLSAARGGAAEVWGVDTSAPAIEVAARSAELNGLTARFEVLDAARAFRKAADEGGYDIVICDPPKLASRRARDRALGNYRKLAAGACAATRLGGLLAFCSCTASVSMDALARTLALGARDAGRRATIVERLFQGADHPVVAAFPEGLYLKTLLARIDTP